MQQHFIPEQILKPVIIPADNPKQLLNCCFIPNDNSGFTKPIWPEKTIAQGTDKN